MISKSRIFDGEVYEPCDRQAAMQLREGVQLSEGTPSELSAPPKHISAPSFGKLRRIAESEVGNTYGCLTVLGVSATPIDGRRVQTEVIVECSCGEQELRSLRNLHVLQAAVPEELKCAKCLVAYKAAKLGPSELSNPAFR